MERTLAGSPPYSVFVLELVSAGYFGDQIGESFRVEGRAMLDAVLGDIRRIPEVAVATLVDQAAEDFRGFLLHVLEHIGTDAALIIAPEFDELLIQFCAAAAQRPQTISLNCSSDALALCSDKLRFAQHLNARDIPTIPAQRIDIDAGPTDFPCVVKPRDGAGSWLVRLVRRPEDWPAVAAEYRAADRTVALAQPFVAGRTCSVAALVHADRPPEIFPIAEQHLSTEGMFRYLGGSIPAALSSAVESQIRQLVERCIQAVHGLHGYIGCDVIVPDALPNHPLIVELNPRLTTSYIGYRELCADNLMERLLFRERFDHPLRWRAGTVLFDPAGHCRYAATPP